MFNKNLVLYTLLGALALLFIATLFYPGGNQQNALATGWSWQHNYISNLFAEKGINGQHNAARPLAGAAMAALSYGMMLFYVQFSFKIPGTSAPAIIRYAGMAGTLCTFLVITNLHDAMITAAVTLNLVAIFYITVFTFKTSLNLLKLLCVLCMLSVYLTVYVYYSRANLLILPTLQKITLLTTVGWVLCMHYLTSREDFEDNLKIS